ncbi:MAG TPA: hypothetical protein VFD36_00465, partial [Kofleriaceae bacterium]|nr:hypothetical protein [Kofleriaceae bacterium]
DPGEAGDQTTNEISYAPYARPPVARSTGGWVVSGNSVSPVATISFPQMTSGSGGVASFWGVGKSVSGPGEVLYSGAISPAITVAVNVTAQLNTATAITED